MRVARIVLCAGPMTTTWLHAGLAVISMCAACGGAVGGTDPAGTDPAGTDREGTDPAGETSSGAQAGQDEAAADELPSSTDPCSVLRPGSAKALPDDIVAPAASPALRITFKLADQRVEASAIRARQVFTPASKQTFSPGETAGSWVETRDAAGTIRYQRSIFDPLGRRIEVAPNPDNPSEGWKNSWQCPSTATFHVDIPGDAVEVRVYGNERADSNSVLLAWYRLH